MYIIAHFPSSSLQSYRTCPYKQNLFLEYINIREIVNVYEEDLIEYHYTKLQRCEYDKIGNYLTRIRKMVNLR